MEHTTRWFGCALAGLTLALLVLPLTADRAVGDVEVRDSGPGSHPATHECTPGHRIDTHQITLDSGTARYAFAYSGCVDPAHGDLRPSAEGNFGMPVPTACNWYWGGFLGVVINGKDAVKYRLADMRVVETGARGAFQVVWAHPDADVGLRVVMLPGGNHVMGELVWRPRAGATIKTVQVQLRCYPSFFTSSRRRKGERHCQTPRIDEKEPKSLTLVPEQDRYLYYYDAVFDTAKGEGDGPCAAMVAPAALRGGRVDIGDYAVMTYLDMKPEAGGARLGLYDFVGRSNAEAEAYLKTNGAGDLTQLREIDFRPEAVRVLNAPQLKADLTRLLAEAGEDGKVFQAKVTELLARVTALTAKAEGGDWTAEADLATTLANSAEMVWKLKAAAILNGP